MLKQNELLSAHVASHEEVRVQAASLMSSMDALAERHKREMAELEARTSEQIHSSMNSRIDEMTERHKIEMAEIEARTSKQIRSSNRMTLVVSYSQCWYSRTRGSLGVGILDVMMESFSLLEELHLLPVGDEAAGYSHETASLQSCAERSETSSRWRWRRQRRKR